MSIIALANLFLQESEQLEHPSGQTKMQPKRRSKIEQPRIQAKLEMKKAYQKRANKELILPPAAATIASLLSITTDPFLHSSSSSSFAFAKC